MKMIQTDRTFGRPNTEIFYDGQLKVVYDGTYGVVNIPAHKIHWSNELLLRGYKEVVEEKESGEVVAEKPASTTRRKAKNG